MESLLEISRQHSELTTIGKRLRMLIRYVPLGVIIVAVTAVIFSATKILTYGYLPPDDALRHAAKAVSGKPWDQILVILPGFSIDHNYGWHVILSALHHTLRWDADMLVSFSVSSLLILFCLAPLPWLRRPEAWLAVLLGFSLYGPLIRMTLGRPFILTSAMLLAVLMLWQNDKRQSVRILAGTTLLMAAFVWIHGSWYLFALPIAAYLLAGRWRSGAELSVCWIIGTLIGASLTGHPLSFVLQAVRIPMSCFGHNTLQRMLVTEFQPSDGNFPFLVAFAIVLVVRRTSGLDQRSLIKDPILVLAVLGWFLGLRVNRFWLDWGAPAMCLWLALEVQRWMELRVPNTSPVRLATSGLLAGALVITMSNDYAGRWTNSLRTEYLSPENPELVDWMPQKGGILYSAEMGVFYRTFFKNPNAEWRYILGFEPTFMPLDDLQVYRKIQWNYGETKAFLPWVKKMRAEDRLVILRDASSQPPIKELEWRYAVSGTWIGRLPRTPALGIPSPENRAVSTSPSESH